MLHLTEADVSDLLTMGDAIAAVEDAFRRLALDEAEALPRRRCRTDRVMLHVLPAALKSRNAVGLKAYTTGPNGATFHVSLYDGSTGEFLALIEADYLGQVRTGAASGVATNRLARADAKTVGLFGTGKQARTQLRAVCAVRAVTDVAVFGRDADRRRAFAEEMARECGVAVRPVDAPRAAAEGRDIVITATSSREPVLAGEWLSPGTHLNIIGSNFLAKSEIDVEAVRRCSCVTIDHKEQGRLEAGDFNASLEQNALSWVDVAQIGDVLIGRRPGRQSDEDITMFKSLGIGLEDIAVATVVYEAAKRRNP